MRRVLPFLVVVGLLTGTEASGYQVETANSTAKLAPTPADICVLEGRGEDAMFAVPRRVGPTRLAKQASATFDVAFVGSDGEEWPSAAVAAFEYAVGIWGQLLVSTVPIRVEATWADLGSCSGSSFRLGAAGPNLIRKDFAGAPRADTWYADALADAVSGQDQGGGDFDIVADFNRMCGPAGSDRWYFGVDGQPVSGRVDFVSVVVHEVGHGLGFFGSANVDDGDNGTGVECDGSAGVGCIGIGEDRDPVVFDHFATNGSGSSLLEMPNPSVGLASTLSGGGGVVRFDGSATRSANNGVAARLYVVSPFNAAVSYSHLDENTYNDTANALMTPFVAQGEAIHDPGDLACAVMQDIGWELSAACGAMVVDPGENQLTNAFPNPFSSRTEVQLVLGEAQMVRVEVFDVLGRRVAVLHDGALAEGSFNRFFLVGDHLPSGLYLVRVEGETFTATRTVTRVK